MIINKLKSESSFIAKNGLSVFLKLFSVALSFFAFRWLNTNLSPEVFEDVNVAIAINVAVAAGLDWGLPHMVQQVYTNYSDSKYRSIAWTSLAFLRLISFGVGLTILYIVSLTGIINFQILFLIFISTFLFLTDNSFRSIVDADNRSWQYSLTDLLSKIILVLLLLGAFSRFDALKNLPDLYIYVLAMSTSALSAVLLDSWIQRKHYQFSKVSKKFITKHKNALFSLTASGLVIGAYTTTDKLFMRVFDATSFEINGYSNAYKLFEIAIMVAGITMPVLASSVLKRIKGFDQTEKRNTIRKYLFSSIVFGVCVALGFLILGPWVLRLIDPEQLYLDIATRSVWTLSLAVVSCYGAVFLSLISILSGNEKTELQTQAIVLLVTIVSYFVLISRFSYIGAGISTTIMYTVNLAIHYYLIIQRKNLSL